MLPNLFGSWPVLMVRLFVWLAYLEHQRLRQGHTEPMVGVLCGIFSLLLIFRRKTCRQAKKEIFKVLVACLLEVNMPFIYIFHKSFYIYDTLYQRERQKRSTSHCILKLKKRKKDCTHLLFHQLLMSKFYYKTLAIKL